MSFTVEKYDLCTVALLQKNVGLTLSVGRTETLGDFFHECARQNSL
jgi:hypothetical protein